MEISANLRLSEYAALIGVTPRRCQFLVKEGIIKPVGGGGGPGRHLQFTEHEARVGRLVVALHKAGVALSAAGNLAWSFRLNWLLADPPRLATGQTVDDVHGIHAKWRKRTQAALQGKTTHLLVAPPLYEGEPGDSDAAYKLDLVTPQELGKALASKRFGSREVIYVINLAQVWAGL